MRYYSRVPAFSSMFVPYLFIHRPNRKMGRMDFCSFAQVNILTSIVLRAKKKSVPFSTRNMPYKRRIESVCVPILLLRFFASQCDERSLCAKAVEKEKKLKSANTQNTLKEIIWCSFLHASAQTNNTFEFSRTDDFFLPLWVRHLMSGYLKADIWPSHAQQFNDCPHSGSAFVSISTPFTHTLHQHFIFSVFALNCTKEPSGMSFCLADS